MALIVDFKVLEELQISPTELLFLYSYKNFGVCEEETYNVELDLLEEKGLIKILEDNKNLYIELRQKALDLLELFNSDVELKANNTKTVKKSNRAINAELEERLPEFRDKWKGLKPGSMGSLHSCRDKLTRWMKENPNYKFDEILKAADMYIASLNGDYRFLQRADYFVYKQENNREESSRLSAFIDEIGEFKPEDWTSSLN